MPKILSSKVSDARPRINASIQSDDELYTIDVKQGFAHIQRGAKTAVLRVAYGEVSSLIDTLSEAKELLSENGYDPEESTKKDDYEAPNFYPSNATKDGSKPASTERTTETAATQGTGFASGQEQDQQTGYTQTDIEPTSDPTTTVIEPGALEAAEAVQPGTSQADGVRATQGAPLPNQNPFAD